MEEDIEEKCCIMIIDETCGQCKTCSQIMVRDLYTNHQVCTYCLIMNPEEQ